MTPSNGSQPRRQRAGARFGGQRKSPPCCLADSAAIICSLFPRACPPRFPRGITFSVETISCSRGNGKRFSRAAQHLGRFRSNIEASRVHSSPLAPLPGGACEAGCPLEAVPVAMKRAAILQNNPRRQKTIVQGTPIRRIGARRVFPVRLALDLLPKGLANRHRGKLVGSSFSPVGIFELEKLVD